jgi:hypothetical protein
MPPRTRLPKPRPKVYNVVRCQRCKFVQAIRMTASCKLCGSRLDASKLQILGSTNRVTDVPLLVRRIKETVAKE